MIRRITGTIIDTTPGEVVLDVHGVGYRVATLVGTISVTHEATLSLWTHLAVRETALDLYGFQTRDELALFEQLLTIPKIGPKSALQIMNQADSESIKKAVLSDDPGYLSKVSGIGKKTAEKIVMGLKDVFNTDTYIGSHATSNEHGTFSADAVDALITLGYAPSDARKVVSQLSPEITNTNDAIKEALKQLGKL